MSASDKKKLRKEQTTELLTQKQRQQQEEDKQLKVYTTIFVAAIALIACIALCVLGVRAFNQSGIVEKNTVAVTIGDEQLNSVEFSYYFNDAINETYSQWYSDYTSYTDVYLQAIGLDTSKPLSEQMNDAENNVTWADYFLDIALNEAQRDAALYNKAMAEGFTLPEEDQENLDNLLTNLENYAKLYGYSNSNQYLRMSYGNGATAKTYKAYCERTAIADAYYEAHEESLEYDDAAIAEYDKDNGANFNSYTYHSSYMSYAEFIQGGTKDEDGNTVHTEEEKAAAREAMKKAAEKMATAKDVDELEEISKTIEVNKDGQIAVNEYKDQMYSQINAPLNEWLADKDRKEGDIAAIPNTSTVKNESGEEVTEINGYYVAVFHSVDDNDTAMGNVRHLLVKFEGGTEDEETGETVYSDEEKAVAKEAADGYLKEWKEGEATEDTFIQLVKDHSEDTSASEGGLFEDIHKDSNYVENFRNWAISTDRKTGDAEVIETEYGYHVMYYVGADELTYRDHMIIEEMRSNDQLAWYDAILEPVSAALADTSKMNLDVILSPSY